MESRYIRQIQLHEVGEEGQQKLANAKVLVIGAGGLGCPALMYLAAAGIGHLGIVDPDIVSISNLHRQLLYAEAHIGQNKATIAAAQLKELHPLCQITTYPVQLNHKNYQEILSPYDVIIDGTDDLPSRYIISDACLLLKKPMVFGALYKFEGQVSVFNFQDGPSYRCLYPNPPRPGDVPSCNETGVLGVLPGMIGILQATEAIKIILELSGILSGKLLYYNLMHHQQRVVEIVRNQKEIDKVIERGRPLSQPNEPSDVVSLRKLAEIDPSENLVFIDVREVDEYPLVSDPRIFQKPLSTLSIDQDEFPEATLKIFFCQSGQRSKKALEKAQKMGYKNYFSLKEGAADLSSWLSQRSI